MLDLRGHRQREDWHRQISSPHPTNQIQPRQRLDALALQSPLAEPLGQYPLPSDQGLLKVPCENEDCRRQPEPHVRLRLFQWTSTESPETVQWRDTVFAVRPTSVVAPPAK